MSRAALRVIDNFLTAAQCEEILATIGAYRQFHEPPLINRAERGRSLRYRVIDGNAVAHALSELELLYRRTGQLIGAWSGRAVTPIEDRVAGININITPPGGEYRWHYDRNAVTALVYLNEVSGGETEVYANHRILLPGWLRTVQPRLDAVVGTRPVRALVGTKSVVAPRAGRLVIMHGDRCLHSVCPVEGSHERINLCMAYDRVGSRGRPHQALDAYLYTEQTVDGPDPNYLC
jgi:2OG-Fe(II) oxygenase superfamily